MADIVANIFGESSDSEEKEKTEDIIIDGGDDDAIKISTGRTIRGGRRRRH